MRHHARRAVAALALVVGALMLGGCAEPVSAPLAAIHNVSTLRPASEPSLLTSTDCSLGVSDDPACNEPCSSIYGCGGGGSPSGGGGESSGGELSSTHVANASTVASFTRDWYGATAGAQATFWGNYFKQTVELVATKTGETQKIARRTDESNELWDFFRGLTRVTEAKLALGSTCGWTINASGSHRAETRALGSWGTIGFKEVGSHAPGASQPACQTADGGGGGGRYRASHVRLQPAVLRVGPDLRAGAVLSRIGEPTRVLSGRSGPVPRLWDWLPGVCRAPCLVHYSDVIAILTEAEILEQITRTIVEQLRPIRIVLFGSRARGDARPDSDYDVMVEMETDVESTDRAGAINRLFADHSWSMDVLVYTPEEILRWKDDVGVVLYDIVREGRLLYCRPDVVDRGFGSTAVPPATRVRETPEGPPESLALWLERAWDDFAAMTAVSKLNPPPSGPVCFHAHQYVEKLLKACLVVRSIRPPRTHDVRELLRLCVASEYELGHLRPACETLYGLWPKSHYPEAAYPSASEAEAAVEAATAVRDAVLALLEQRRAG
jgi:HEPN domain-containing protein/predicted nucleotidyltransferase